MHPIDRALQKIEANCDDFDKGRYDDISERMADIEALLKGDEALSASRDQITQLAHSLRRHERLSKAARDGFKSALAQIQTHTRSLSQIETYSGSGKRLNISGDTGGPLRRV